MELQLSWRQSFVRRKHFAVSLMPRALSCVKRLLEDSGARGFLVKICRKLLSGSALGSSACILQPQTDTTAAAPGEHGLDGRQKSNTFGCAPSWSMSTDGKFRSEMCES